MTLDLTNLSIDSDQVHGSNENTNGLLRQYFPRTADLSVYTRTDLASVRGN